KAFYVDTIDTIFKIARALVILQKRHYGTGMRGGLTDALVQYGFTNRDGGPMQKSIRSNYTTLLDHEAEGRKWWKGVPERTKRDWLSARAIHRHWIASKKPRDPDASRKPTPLQQERATNVALQEQLHEATTRLKTADGGNLFDLDKTGAETIGKIIVK